jgi:hypothetical protein
MSSESSTFTAASDLRQALDGALGVNLYGSNLGTGNSGATSIAFTQTDYGSVSRALDFADRSLMQGAAAIGNAATIQNNAVIGAIEASDRARNSALDFGRVALSSSTASTEKSLSSALGFAGDALNGARSAFSTAIDKVSSAYDAAKGEGDEKQTLFYVAIAAVALVAVVTVWGKH